MIRALPISPAGVRLTLVRRIGASAVLMMTLVLTAPAEAAGGIAVSPHSGRSGTRFVVSFVAPRPEPARGYHVRLRAANTQEEGCVAKIDFYNPKAVRAGLRMSFAFTTRASDELCTGTWKVSVRAAPSAASVLSGGRFTLS